MALRIASLAAIGLLLVAEDAQALDKQGSAHGGDVGSGNEEGFDISGSLLFGSALVNPTYAARPDNTGIALFRYALHADVDVIGPKLSFPIDVNMFTSRDRKGSAIFSPTELDVIGGVTTTHPLGKGDVELGARVEHDRPVDRGGFTQSYADVRARYLFSLARIWPSLGRDLADGDISGHVALGWFAFNPTYAARPDNTGLALFRYVLHTELSVWHDHVSVGADTTFFSDRREDDPIKPTELDFTYEIIGRADPFELHVAFERDMPIGARSERGLVQSFMYALLAYNFDLKRDVLKPLQARGAVISP